MTSFFNYLSPLPWKIRPRKPQKTAARSQATSNHSVPLLGGPKKMNHKAERKSTRNNAQNAFHAFIPKVGLKLLLSII